MIVGCGIRGGTCRGSSGCPARPRTRRFQAWTQAGLWPRLHRAAAVHAQLYTMGSVLRHGNEEQKRRYLPKIASGELRLQAFGVTEPTAGTDTTSLRTMAKRTDDGYVVNGQKVFISRVRHSDSMLLLARTTPRDEVVKRSEGISLFLIDLREARGIDVRPLRTMVNHETNEVFLNDVHIPVDSLVGTEGKGSRYVLDGVNAVRALIAAERRFLLGGPESCREQPGELISKVEPSHVLLCPQLPGMPQEKVMANLRRLSDVIADLRAEGESP